MKLLLPTIPTFSRAQRQHLFTLLCLTTLFDFVLLGGRIYFTGFDLGELNSIRDVTSTRGTTFLFLAWNLFLAWIPYWISLTLRSLSARWLIGLALLSWLLFFPNAPYILTDLLHLRERVGVPHWYDLMLIVSFAWTGLILGFISLLEVQQFLQERMRPRLAWILTLLAITLCSYGVYIGRFQRWNTWDVLTNPLALARDIVSTLSNPGVYLGTLGITVVLGGFLLLSYWTLVGLFRRDFDK